MIEILLAILVMAGVGIIQSAIVSRMPLLSGTADLILLVLASWTVQDRVRNPWVWGLAAGAVATILSGLPPGILLSAYTLVTGLAYLTRRRIWRAPLLTTMAVTVAGTLLIAGLSVFGVLTMGMFIDFVEAFNLIVLPGLLLNLLLTIPIYVLVREFTRWIYRGDASVPADGEL